VGVETVSTLLARGADEQGDRTALLAPGRLPLSYSELAEEVEALAGQLRRHGVGPRDRIALVAPDGPELAIAFLAAASVGACAPLNPRYTEHELGPLLEDLAPAAVIAASGLETPARRLARDAGTPIVELEPRPGGAAGQLMHAASGGNGGSPPAQPAPEDVALLLHTSGTTSKPKLVPLSQANLCASTRSIATTLGLTPADRCFGVMPMFHIHGIMAGLLATVRAGGSLVATPGFDPRHAIEWLRETDATWYTAVPTVHQALLDALAGKTAAEHGISLRFARSSSAPLPRPLRAELEAALEAPVIEAYGMTEASHQIASNPLPPGTRRPGTVGRPAGADIAILSPEGEELAAGERGEIAIRGPGVTAGYLDAPAANRAAFSNGWLRTGDLGSFDEEGHLRIDGRAKEIINRGGDKIAPREIDDALVEHPSVLQAVAFGVPHPTLGEEPAAAVVLRTGAGGHPEDLRAHLAGRLAPYKVPRQVVLVDAIPKGATGKLQRSGLAAKLGLEAGIDPAPVSHGVSSDPDDVAGSAGAEPSALQSALLAVWATVLDEEPRSLDADFFTLGGDSLRAMSLIGQVQDAFGVELEVADVFSEASTVRGMATTIERVRANGAPRRTGPASTPGATGTHPPSPAQRRIWWLAQLAPDLPTYNLPIALSLRGELDREALGRALNEIVRRHEPLRTGFESVAGEPVARVHPPYAIQLAPALAFPSSAEALAVLGGEVRAPFDLERGELLRGRLCELSRDEHLLVMSSHHLAFDGWSRSVFIDELRGLYAAFASGAGAPSAAPLPRYGVFAATQGARLEGPEFEADLDYWRRRLAGAKAIEIATDRPRPSAEAATGGSVSAVLPAAAMAGVERLAKERRTTTFVVLLSAFAELLARYSQRRDLVMGCPTAGRTVAGAERLIGMFVNTLPLRLELDAGESFGTAVGRAHGAMLDALGHQHVSFERIVEELELERALGRDPLAPVTFQLRNMPPPATPQPPGLEIDNVPWIAGIAQAELAVELTDTEDGLECLLRYRSDLWEAETARRIVRHYAALVGSLTAAPDEPAERAAMLGRGERRRLQRLSTGRPLRSTGEPAHRRFERHAEREPDAVAVDHRGERITYGGLNRDANRVAGRLAGLGIGAGDIVGVGLPRRLGTIAAFLGVLKAGGAFLPLDPAHPAERCGLMLSDSGAKALIAEPGAAWDDVGAGIPVLDPADPSLAEETPGNPADAPPASALSHILYTSGSTGRPKAVMVERRNVEALIDWAGAFFTAAELRGVLASSAFGFDLSTFEVMAPLTHGGTVVLVENALDLVADPPSAAVSLVNTVASALAEVVRNHDLPASVEVVTLSGEPLGRALVERLYAMPGIRRVVNLSGPTEDTVVDTADVCPRFVAPGSSPPPVGRPLAGRRTLVLGERGELLPIGVPGELHLGGAGLTRGYLGREELTTERFVELEIDGRPRERLYRSGDLARWREDGRLEIVARMDRQLKVRGFRIEPGEVEAALTAHPDVSEAAVGIGEGPAGPALVAHVVGDPSPSAAALRAWLGDRLPAHMIPGSFSFPAALPVSARGKRDRAQLLAPEQQPAGEPMDETGAAVAEVWRSVLGLASAPGAGDDFFALGGHSFLALRLTNEIEKRLGTRIPLATVFRAPTLAAFADELRAVSAGGAASGPGAEVRGPRLYSLFVDRPGFEGMQGIAAELGGDIPMRPLVAWDMREDGQESVEAIAAQRVGLIRGEQPEGPYLVAGHSLGGAVAVEIAHQLEAAGERVDLVAVFDTRAHLTLSSVGRLRWLGSRLRGKSPRDQARAISGFVTRAARLGAGHVASGKTDAPWWTGMAAPLWRIYSSYDPKPVRAPFVVFCTRFTQLRGNDPKLGWERAMGRPVEVVVVPGSHESLLHGDGQEALARELRRRLRNCAGQ
jgi:amino acid adenylation domain-containing protein